MNKRINVLGDGVELLEEFDSDNEAVLWVNRYTRFENFGGYSFIWIVGKDDPSGDYLVAIKDKSDGWSD
jgi:hypothetical protein